MKYLYGKLVLIAVILFLTACGGRVQNSHDFTESFYAAVAAGYLLPIDNAGDGAGHTTATIEVGLSHAGMRRTLSFVWIHFSKAEPLRFTHSNRYIVNIYVQDGQMVSAGDVLATSAFEPSEILLAQQRLLQQEVARFEADIADESSRLRSEIAELRHNMPFAAEGEWERYALKLSLQELLLEQHLHNSRRERENMRKRLTEMNDMLAQEQLIAPICGMVTILQNLLPGAEIDDEQPMIVIADISSLYFMANYSPGGNEPSENVMIRYGDVLLLQIEDVMDLYVRVVSDNYAAGFRAGTQMHNLLPVNPEDADALMHLIAYNRIRHDRLNMQLRLTWNMFGEGIVMFGRNIHWDAYRPFVLLYENGSIGRRFVTLAPYNLRINNYLYVISGLEPGQRVVGE